MSSKHSKLVGTITELQDLLNETNSFIQSELRNVNSGTRRIKLVLNGKLEGISQLILEIQSDTMIDKVKKIEAYSESLEKFSMMQNLVSTTLELNQSKIKMTVLANKLRITIIKLAYGWDLIRNYLTAELLSLIFLGDIPDVSLEEFRYFDKSNTNAYLQLFITLSQAYNGSIEVYTSLINNIGLITNDDLIDWSNKILKTTNTLFELLRMVDIKEILTNQSIYAHDELIKILFEQFFFIPTIMAFLLDLIQINEGDLGSEYYRILKITRYNANSYHKIRLEAESVIDKFNNAIQGQLKKNPGLTSVNKYLQENLKYFKPITLYSHFFDQYYTLISALIDSNEDINDVFSVPITFILEIETLLDIGLKAISQYYNYFHNSIHNLSESIRMSEIFSIYSYLVKLLAIKAIYEGSPNLFLSPLRTNVVLKFISELPDMKLFFLPYYTLAISCNLEENVSFEQFQNEELLSKFRTKPNELITVYFLRLFSILVSDGATFETKINQIDESFVKIFEILTEFNLNHRRTLFSLYKDNLIKILKKNPVSWYSFNERNSVKRVDLNSLLNFMVLVNGESVPFFHLNLASDYLIPNN